MGMRGTRGGTPTKPKHTEESIQQALYWNHPILTKPAFEMVGFIFYAWESDYLAISKAGYVYECEIKNHYQKWRRGGNGRPPHPFVVGQTIDNAIRALRRITKDTPKF